MIRVQVLQPPDLHQGTQVPVLQEQDRVLVHLARREVQAEVQVVDHLQVVMVVAAVQ
ncbi:MAG: hypothetical protein SFT81_06505 [Candidatus Caenarcaniphilales bacterium]|nr:hypothetical protein [Candidatus Caenarcaniphilales bacterium]